MYYAINVEGHPDDAPSYSYSALGYLTPDEVDVQRRALVGTLAKLIPFEDEDAFIEEMRAADEEYWDQRNAELDQAAHEDMEHWEY